MAYSRMNTKKAMSICDAIGSLLESKERMRPDIEETVQHASHYMELALAKMQLEAAERAEENERYYQALLPLFTVDQGTGEVVSAKASDDR